MWQWKKEEACGTAVLILFAMGNYVQVLMPGWSAGGDQYQFSSATHSNLLSKITVGCLVLAALLPVVLRLRSLMRAAFACLPLLPYLTIAVASILWSQNAALSLQRVISLLATSLFGLYFSVMFSQRTQVRMLLAATSIPALLSILMVLIAPQYAINETNHAGAWQGVFGGKNACAMVMVIGVAAAMSYEPKSIVTRMWKVTSLVLFTVIAVKADSSAAVVVLLAMVVLVHLLRHLTRYEPRTRALLCSLLAIFCILAGIVATQSIPEILKLLNRDATLTGRTVLWAQVWQSITERPLLGYGYGAFWNGLSGPSARIVLSMGWNAPHAHNGFLDIWLCLGLLGLAAFCLLLVQCVFRILQVMQSHEMGRNLWLITGFVLVILYNLDESVLIFTPSLMWTIFVSGVCGLELYARQASEQHKKCQSLATDEVLSKPQFLSGFTDLGIGDPYHQTK